MIVSHERELEGAVDHIFRIQKDGGKSKVYAVTMAGRTGWNWMLIIMRKERVRGAQNPF